MNALDYARKLVAFESTSNLSNLAVTDHVQKTLEQLGFVVERIEFDDDDGVSKASVVGKKGDGLGGMAYFGHTDVVPANPWFTQEHGPFEPTIKGDKLYGRGSCDMKGSIACMLAAAEQYSQAAEFRKPLYITCTADEEVGFGGAKQVALESRFFQEMVEGESNGIIGEPTALEVVYAHKGTFGFKVISRGQAAHSSTRDGLNANLAMIPFLNEMKRIHDETAADSGWRNEEFDPPDICWNIGINDHTPAINIKPPQSVCTVYFRPMPGQDPDVLINESRQIAERHGLEFRSLWRGQALYTDPDSDFVAETLSLVEQEKPAQTVSYGTDGSMLTALKSLVLLGPGDIAQAHTWDEWIALSQLERGTEIFAKLIGAWCS